jgi:AcrR family transcriptional regulator
MKAGDEKERILLAAREKFFRYGFHRVTVDELAADLGMSKKTIYKHFPTKSDLVRAVIYATRDAALQEITGIINSPTGFEEKAAALFTVIGRVWGKMSRQLPADMRRFAPDLWKEIETFRREQILTKITRMFREAKDQGVLRQDVNQDVFVLAFLSTVDGIINPQTLSEHSFSADEAFRQILKILFTGVLADAYRHKIAVLESASLSNESQRLS